MSRTNGEILEFLMKNQIQRERLQKTKKELLYLHKMKMNKFISLENKLKMERDIAFRELAYELKQEFNEKEKKRVSMEDLFPESGPLDLSGYDFLE
jgi:hypothetical protein